MSFYILGETISLYSRLFNLIYKNDMKEKFGTLFITISVFIVGQIISAQTNWSVQFADAIISRWPNSINDMTGKSWEYSNSIILYGIEKVYEETGNADYLNYIKKFVDNYVDADGNVSFKTTANNLDYLHPGLLLLFLYEQTGEIKYKTAATQVRARFDTHPTNASGGFWHKDNYPNQMWLDGIYMAEPFLIKYGSMFNDTAYCNNQATFQTLLLAEHAYDPTAKLLYHGWDETKTAIWANATTGVSPCIWSRGMGWYAMALIDILKYLPSTNNRYNEMLTLVNNIAEGLKNSQDATTGLWYQVVDKGGTAGNWIETSGSGMFIYFLKHAINQKYIDASYNTIVDKAWTGMQNNIFTYSGDNMPGIKNYVGAMGILDSYSSYVSKTTSTCPTSSHPHGYCAILMASTAMENTVIRKFEVAVSTIGNGAVEFINGQSLSDSGTVIKLKAVPFEGYEFYNWTGDKSGSLDSIEFILTENINITANFNKIPNFENIYEAEKGTWSDGSVVENEYAGFSGTGYVNTENNIGSYIEFSVNKEELKKYNFKLYFANGGTEDRPVSVSVNDTIRIESLSCKAGSWTTWDSVSLDLIMYPGDNRIRFTSLTALGTANIDRLTFISSVNVSQYSLSILNDGSGNVAITPDNDFYIEGSYVNLKAVPEQQNKFSHWEGDIAGNNPDTTIIMDDNKNITAVYAINPVPQYTITLLKTGYGSITLDPESPLYDSATIVNLTATPDKGYIFGSWSGDVVSDLNNISVTMNGNINLTAEFILVVIPKFSLNITANGSGSVTVTPEAAQYDSGTVVNILATANTGYLFDGYTGDINTKESNVNITVNKTMDITANFKLIEGLNTNHVRQNKIYPNPVKNTLFISTEYTINKIEILNNNGSVIESKSYYNQQITSQRFDLSNYSKGIYFIKIITEKDSQIKCFIKE